MSWLPRFHFIPCRLHADECDETYDGWILEIVWGRFYLELSFGIAA